MATTTRPWTGNLRYERTAPLRSPTNTINHVALCLDGSTSIRDYGLEHRVVELADEWIKNTAEASQRMNQETRVSVYLFGHHVECLIYEMDALRLPSIKTLYKIAGNTALLDCVLQALKDQEQVPTKFEQVQRIGHPYTPYGDHGFLVYAITDGEENASRCEAEARRKLQSLGEGFNVGLLIPEHRNAYGRMSGRDQAIAAGFKPEHILGWVPTDAGLKEAMRAVNVSTQGYMDLRARGIKTSAGLFTPDVSHLNASTLSSLPTLGPGQFKLLRVPTPIFAGYDDLTAEKKRKHWPEIAAFVANETGAPYVLGQGYYQLTKPEEVQPQKKVAIYQKKGHTVYTGAAARTLLGLPNYSTRVNPAVHPDYTIFVQSTSVNRKLEPETDVLLIYGLP